MLLFGSLHCPIYPRRPLLALYCATHRQHPFRVAKLIPVRRYQPPRYRPFFTLRQQRQYC